MREFVAGRPRASLLSLAEELVGPAANANELVPPMASLQDLVLEQAMADGTLASCARDLLVRALHLKIGAWPTWDDRTGRNQLGACLLGWAAGIGSRIPEVRRHAINTALALLEAPIPRGWMPEDRDDRLLSDVFDRHWTGG